MSLRKNSVESKSIILRRYPKVIFFYPLFIISIILCCIQYYFDVSTNILGYIWIIILFLNLFVVAFETNSTRLFVAVVIIILSIIIFFYVILPYLNIDLRALFLGTLDLSLTTEFYLVVTIILGFILFFVWFEERFEYWKIEKNEVYHKKGFLANLKRFPTANLEYTKEITDVFEYIALRAGKITLIINDKTAFTLDTVVNVNKKIKELDELLSQFRVKVVNP